MILHMAHRAWRSDHNMVKGVIMEVGTLTICRVSSVVSTRQFPKFIIISVVSPRSWLSGLLFSVHGVPSKLFLLR